MWLHKTLVGWLWRRALRGTGDKLWTRPISVPHFYLCHSLMYWYTFCLKLLAKFPAIFLLPLVEPIFLYVYAPGQHLCVIIIEFYPHAGLSINARPTVRRVHRSQRPMCGYDGWIWGLDPAYKLRIDFSSLLSPQTAWQRYIEEVRPFVPRDYFDIFQVRE